MNIRIRLEATALCAALAATLCIGMATAASAAVGNSAIDASNPDALKPIDQLEELAEIRVRGKSLARSITDAEDDFFVLYNKVNTNADYDVFCGHMSVNGSLIMKRTCLPGFIADRVPVHPARWYPVVSTGGCSFLVAGTHDFNDCYSAPVVYFPPEPSVSAVVMHRGDAYVDHVLKVINSDPRLVAKVRHIDSLYAEMQLVQGRFTKVRAITPFKVDPRQRPR